MSQDSPIERWSRLLAEYPDHELARFSLGKAYFDAGQFELAAEQFQRAVARKADWMAAHILLGRCQMHLGQREAAVATLQHAHHLARVQNHQGPLAETAELLRELGPAMD
jgi:tetratricopeptide (TPR) repeat protein